MSSFEDYLSAYMKPSQSSSKAPLIFGYIETLMEIDSKFFLQSNKIFIIFHFQKTENSKSLTGITIVENLNKKVQSTSKQLTKNISSLSGWTDDQRRFFQNIQEFHQFYEAVGAPKNVNANLLKQISLIITQYGLNASGYSKSALALKQKQNVKVVGLETEINAYLSNASDIIKQLTIKYEKKYLDALIGNFIKVVKILQKLKTLKTATPYYGLYQKSFRIVLNILTKIPPQFSDRAMAQLTVTKSDRQNQLLQERPNQNEMRNQTQGNIAIKNKVTDQVLIEKVLECGSKIQAANQIIQIQYSQLGSNVQNSNIIEPQNAKALVVVKSVPKVLIGVINSVKPYIQKLVESSKSASSLQNKSPRKSNINTIIQCYLNQVLHLNNNLLNYLKTIKQILPIDKIRQFDKLIYVSENALEPSIGYIYRRILPRTRVAPYPSSEVALNIMDEQKPKIRQYSNYYYNVILNLDKEQQKRLLYFMEQNNIGPQISHDLLKKYMTQTTLNLQALKDEILDMKNGLIIARNIYKDDTKQIRLQNKKILEAVSDLSQKFTIGSLSNYSSHAQQFNLFIQRLLLYTQNSDRTGIHDYLKNNAVISDENKRKICILYQRLDLINNLQHKHLMDIPQGTYDDINALVQKNRNQNQNIVFNQQRQLLYQSCQILDQISRFQVEYHQQVIERFNRVDVGLKQIKQIVTKILSIQLDKSRALMNSTKLDEKMIGQAKFQTLQNTNLDQLLNNVQNDDSSLSAKVDKILSLIEKQGDQMNISQSAMLRHYGDILKTGVDIQTQIQFGQKQIMRMLNIKIGDKDVQNQIITGIKARTDEIYGILQQMHNAKKENSEDIKKYIQFQSDSITAYLTTMGSKLSGSDQKLNLCLSKIIQLTGNQQSSSMQIFYILNQTLKQMELSNYRLSDLAAIVNKLFNEQRLGFANINESMQSMIQMYQLYTAQLVQISNVQNFQQRQQMDNVIKLINENAVYNQNINNSNTISIQKSLAELGELFVSEQLEAKNKIAQQKKDSEKLKIMAQQKDIIITNILITIDKAFNTDFSTNKDIHEFQQFIKNNTKKWKKFQEHSTQLNQLKILLSEVDPSQSPKMVLKSIMSQLKNSKFNYEKDISSRTEQYNRQIDELSKQLNQMKIQREKCKETIQSLSFKEVNLQANHQIKLTRIKDEFAYSLKSKQNQLKNQIKQLKVKIQHRQQQLRKLNKIHAQQTSDLKAKVKEFDHYKESQQSIKRQLKLRMTQLQSQITKLKNSPNQYEINKKYQDQLNLIKYKLAASQTKQKAMILAKEEIESAIHKSNLQVNRLKTQLQSHNRQKMRELQIKSQQLLSCQKNLQKITKVLRQRQHQIQTVTNQLQSQKSKVKKMKSVNQEIKEQNQKLQKTNKKLITVQAQFQKLKTKSISDKRKLDQMSELEEDLASKKAMVAELSSKLASVNAGKYKNKKQQQQIEAKSNKLKLQLEKCERKCDEYKINMKNLIEKKDNQKKALESKLSTYTKLQDKNQSLQDDMKKVLKQKQSLQLQLAQKQKQINQLKKSLENDKMIKSHLSNVQKQLINVNGQKEMLRVQLNQLKKQQQTLIILRQKITQTQIEKDLAEKNVKKLQDIILKNQEQIRTVKAQLKITQNRQKELQLKLLNQNVEKSRMKILQKQKQNQQQRIRINKQSQLLILQKKIKDLETKIANCQDQKHKKIQQLESKQIVVRQLEQRNKKLIKQVEQTRQKQDQKNRELRRISEKLGKYNMTPEQITSFIQQKQQLTKKIAVLKKHGERDTKLRKSMVKILAIIKKQISELQQKYSECYTRFQIGQEKAQAQASLYQQKIQQLNDYVEQLVSTSKPDNQNQTMDDSNFKDNSRQGHLKFSISNIRYQPSITDDRSVSMYGNFIGMGSDKQTHDLQKQNQNNNNLVSTLEETIRILQQIIVKIFIVTQKAIKQLTYVISRFKDISVKSKRIKQLLPLIMNALNSLQSHCLEVVQIIKNGTQKQLKEIDQVSHTKYLQILNDCKSKIESL